MKIFLLPLFLLLSLVLQGQNKWEHGVAIGMNLTDFKETYLEDELVDFDGPLIMTSFYIWNAYNFNDNMKLSLSPGFSWKGAKTNYAGHVYDGVYTDLPLVFHLRALPNIYLSPGFSYQYLISFGENSNREVYNLTSEVENKHLLSWSTGITYNVNSFFDINFNFAQAFNTVYKLDVIDFNNNELGVVDLKNKSFQLQLIVKH